MRMGVNMSSRFAGAKECLSLNTISNIEIAVGNECNQRCIYCYQEDQRAGHNIPDFIWQDRLLPVYPHLKSINIIGGEPTIMNGVKRMLDFLEKNFPHIKLTTISNGQRFDGFWQDCFVTRGRKVSFSVNAASAETHKYITLGGRFNDTIDNISSLVQRRKRQKSSLQVHISFVVTRENHHETADFIRLGESLGVDRCIFILDFVRKLKHLYPDIMKSIHLALDVAASAGIEVVGLEEILCQMGQHMEVAKKGGDEDYYCKICPMPWQSLDIRKDCSVSFCNAAWISLGSLRERDIQSLWNSKSAMKMRNLISKGDYRLCKPGCTMNINPRLCKSKTNYLLAVRRLSNKFTNDPIGVTKKVIRRVRHLFE
jgi:MoaA/NifB/PqqE/SkfB family radical SAM enzyme